MRCRDLDPTPTSHLERDGGVSRRGWSGGSELEGTHGTQQEGKRAFCVRVVGGSCAWFRWPHPAIHPAVPPQVDGAVGKVISLQARFEPAVDKYQHFAYIVSCAADAPSPDSGGVISWAVVVGPALELHVSPGAGSR